MSMSAMPGLPQVSDLRMSLLRVPVITVLVVRVAM